MLKFTRVIFTDRPVNTKKFKAYTYNSPVDFELQEGDMVVMQAQDGYSIGQVAGFIDSIDFDKDLLKEIVTKFEVLDDGKL